MSPAAILARLRDAGVELHVLEGRIRYRAPRGAYTPQLRKLVAQHQVALRVVLAAAARPDLPAAVESWPAELRELYEERAGIREHDGGLDRDEAERAAEAEVRRLASRAGTP